jgi:predicted ribosome-associated RNA-binding protein Tma20
LLVVEGTLVTLPLFKLDDVLHLSLCVLDDDGVDRDVVGVDDWGAADCVIAGANLVDVVESEDVADLCVVKTVNGDNVAGGKEVLPAYQ